MSAVAAAAHHRPRIRCVSTLRTVQTVYGDFATGLDIEQKAERYLDAVFPQSGWSRQFDDVDVQLIRSDYEDPESNEVAHAALRVTITHHDPSLVGGCSPPR